MIRRARARPTKDLVRLAHRKLVQTKTLKRTVALDENAGVSARFVKAIVIVVNVSARVS